jgi:hypothetical protein
MIVPFLGFQATVEAGREVLNVVVKKGNPKEIFLKSTEALQGIAWEREVLEDEASDEVDLVETISKVTIGDGCDPLLQLTELYNASRAGMDLFSRL